MPAQHSLKTRRIQQALSPIVQLLQRRLFEA